MSKPDLAAREKFQSLLRDLFQIRDAAELDFGIYRIMGQKRTVIEEFIDRELLAEIDAALRTGPLRQESQAAAQMAELAAQIRETLADDAIDADGNLNPSFEMTKLGRDYLAVQKRARGTKSGSEQEASIYNHLYQFFSRYYDKGDFLSLRRYSKREKYAIPYNGEEVYLHWANADQYYVKTGETFTDYRWKDPSGAVRVRFTVTRADVAKDNIKSPETRYFLPRLDDVTVETVGTGPKDPERHTLLTLPFHYRGLTETETKHFEKIAADRGLTGGNGSGNKLQAAALAETVEMLPKNAPVKGDTHLLAALLAEHHRDADGAPVGRLAHHLRRFTVKNTSDYFIHKDLGGFLTRELDFYLKNEVLHLDTLEAGGEERAEGWFETLRVMRRIGGTIIRFLAQIENFQKRIFEKKKFVTECHYCLTLDRVPEELYPEIAKNAAQIAEWKKLFAIEEVKGWIEPPTVKFLKENWNLVVDTRFFGEEFVELILSDETRVDGVLVNSENFQGINLLGEALRGSVDVIYIDPPYNTDASPIVYKNGYKASSWCSLIQDRVSASKSLLKQEGILIGAIDDAQEREMDFIFSSIFENRILGTFCVRSNPSGRPQKTGYSVSHEYMIYAGNSDSANIRRLPPTDEQMARFNQEDEEGPFEWRNLRREGSNSDRSARRQLHYPIFIQGEKIRVPKMQWNEREEEWETLERPGRSEVEAWPINEQGEEKTWRWEHSTVSESLSKLSVRPDRSGKPYIYYMRRPHDDGVVAVSSWFDAKHSSVEHGTAVLKDLFGNSKFSFPKSIHAVTDAIYIGGAARENATVLDFFGGSGTTGHAVISLNRKDGGLRKYFLIEQETYFDSVLKSRIQKVIYSSEWNSGKPKSRNTGISHCFQYLTLESYEDALGNIAFDTNEVAQRQLRFDEYVIHYMLAFETGGSETLLDTDRLTAPFDYKLEIRDGDESVVKPVDLPETFNFLLGLRVRTRRVLHREVKRGKKSGPLRYLVLRGRTNPHATGGEREVVVIWRTTVDWTQEDYQADRAFIDEHALTDGADEVFVNDQSLLRHPNAKSLDPVFKRRMFNELD
jgi:adenine-specific DNA-methyltransferase